MNGVESGSEKTENFQAEITFHVKCQYNYQPCLHESLAGFFYMEHFFVPWTGFCSGVLFDRNWTCPLAQSEQTFELFTSVPPLPLSL